jgi:hypothetical protein
MKRLFRLLDKFWFPEAPPARLAVLRILVGIYAFCLVAGNYSRWVKIGRESPDLFKPVGPVALLSRPLPPAVSQALILAALVASVLFILGWRYRFTGPAFAALLLWVVAYRLSWSMIYHSMHVLTLHVLVLGVSPAADALSLDARRRSAARQRQQPASALHAVADYYSTAPGWEYGFPIQLICAVTVLTYFVTGMAKLAGPLGTSWVTGEALRSQVAADAIRKEVLGDAGSPLFYRLYKQVWLFAIMGVSTIVLELGAPLALLKKQVGRLWAVSAFFMHWGILAIMAITFSYHLSGILYASFFDLEVPVVWFRGLAGRRAAAVVAVKPATP